LIVTARLVSPTVMESRASKNQSHELNDMTEEGKCIIDFYNNDERKMGYVAVTMKRSQASAFTFTYARMVVPFLGIAINAPFVG